MGRIQRFFAGFFRETPRVYWVGALASQCATIPWEGATGFRVPNGNASRDE